MARLEWTRRDALRATVAAAFHQHSPAYAQAELPSLKSAAAAVGLRYGSDSDVKIDDAPSDYAALFAAQCGLLAPVLSWQATSPNRLDTDPGWEDPNIRFAQRHGMQLTGGHFLWHERVPRWFAQVPPGLQAQAAVDRHITQLGNHYSGRVYSWNVVNEAIDTRNGDRDGMRRSILTEKLGADWIPAAFRTARATDPHALLLYNEAGLEMASRRHAARRDAMLRLLDRLQRDAPIDGVGLQSHLRLDEERFDPAIYQRFLDTIASRGLAILITELDVLDLRGNGDIERRDKEVAEQYRDFLSVALAQPAVRALVSWGLSDRYTWLTPDYNKSFARPDKLPARPLPFDAAFKPKPAFFAILDALKAAPRRQWP